MASSSHLISPIADRSLAVTRAPRLSRAARLTIYLIDGMQNRKAGWGRALLDGAEDVLTRTCVATFVRVERPLGSPSFSEDPAWARGLVGRVDLLIEAVGD